MKKVVSLLLALMMVAGLSVTAFAADPVYTFGLGQSEFIQNTIIQPDGSWAWEHQTYASNRNGSIDLNDVKPGDVLKYFVIVKDTANNLAGYATRSMIKSEKVAVKVKVSEGSKALDGVSLSYDSKFAAAPNVAYVEVEFVDPFVSVDDLDFNYTIYLTIDKKRDTDTELQIVGTIENHKQEVDENDDYVYMYDTPVVEAEDYIKLMECEIGQGVTIWAKMFDGKKYYAYITQEIKAEDDDVVTQYPSIDTIYYLSTINMNSSGNYVTFDIDDRMYVYNSDLEYIGTTSDRLPYSTKYFLSTVELDVGDADIEVLPGDDTNDLDNVPGGGDEVPANANQNPGTGK